MQPRFTITNPFEFLWKNRDTLLLAILLAIAVWVSAVYATDPNQEQTVEPNVTLEVNGLSDSLVLMSSIPPTVEVRLRAPASVWATLAENPELLTAEVDLSNIQAGDHTVPVILHLAASPAQILAYQPSEVEVVVDRLVTREDVPLELIQTGLSPQGFLTESANFELDGEALDQVTVFGPSSRMEKVERVIGEVSIDNQRQSFTQTVTLHAVNDQDEIISGVTVTPDAALARVDIVQAGQYKDVAVVVETIGQPTEGYERTTIDVDPLIVTLYAEDEEDIEDIPGFVSTVPIVLTGKSESFVTQVELALPPNVQLADEGQIIAASIGIEPKIKSISLTVEIRVSDLPEGLQASTSPETAELTITGPEPVINALLPGDLVVFVSLDGADVGTQFVELEYEVLVDEVSIISINPDRVEVIVDVLDLNSPPTTTAPTSTPAPGP
jgi:YbbR domain-containing protein